MTIFFNLLFFSIDDGTDINQGFIVEFFFCYYYGFACSLKRNLNYVDTFLKCIVAYFKKKKNSLFLSSILHFSGMWGVPSTSTALCIEIGNYA